MSKTKTLHPRNFHNTNYDFILLIKTEPRLKEFVKINRYGNLSIDFANPKAVLILNKALLSYFYKMFKEEFNTTPKKIREEKAV